MDHIKVIVPTERQAPLRDAGDNQAVVSVSGVSVVARSLILATWMLGKSGLSLLRSGMATRLRQPAHGCDASCQRVTVSEQSDGVSHGHLSPSSHITAARQFAKRRLVTTVIYETRKRLSGRCH